MQTWASRHPVLTALAALVAVGVVIDYWWAVLLVTAVVGGAFLWHQQRERRRELELAQVQAALAQANADQVRAWSYLRPEDLAWLRGAHLGQSER